MLHVSGHFLDPEARAELEDELEDEDQLPEDDEVDATPDGTTDNK
jgi:hypothetical protein